VFYGPGPGILDFHLLLIFPRRYLVYLLKSQYIVTDAGIAYFIGDLADGFCVGGDHLLRLLYSFIPYIFGNGHPMDRLEKEVQPVLAGIRFFQDGVDRKRIRTIIFGNIGFHFPDQAEVILVVDTGQSIGAQQAAMPVTEEIFQKG
jgi:hypothetical protein